MIYFNQKFMEKDWNQTFCTKFDHKTYNREAQLKDKEYCKDKTNTAKIADTTCTSTSW